MSNSADYVLLDVPCSGSGVIKREPDTKWKLQPEHLDRLESVQFSIIRDYSRLLKIDGIMVYATCSILPKENRLQVDAFLAHPAGAQFELLEDCTVDPSHHNDGFYMARLRKLA